jgi:ubiquinone/menaquinone biosynthesis C-methylase UbiE
MPRDATSRSRSYYDEFSESYEARRHHGYHALIDELEVEAVGRYGGGRVLEAGCGTGLILDRLRPYFREVVGVDLSSGMLARARDRRLQVVQASIDQLPFPNASFDVVVSFKVLAHVPDIRATLAELSRVTRPGGVLVLEFYNPHSLRGLVKRLKRPSRIGASYTDTDVYTRYDTLEDIRCYLPGSVQLVGVRGVRVVTPAAQLHDVPLVGPLLARAERLAAEAPFLRSLGGFLIAILEKSAAAPR